MRTDEHALAWARLEALTRAADDAATAVIGAEVRLAAVARCREAVDSAGEGDAEAALASLSDPPTARMLRAQFERGGLVAARAAARALHVEARAALDARRLSAAQMAALCEEARCVSEGLSGAGV